MVARFARLSSRRSISLSWPTRIARRAPSSSWSAGIPLCLSRANSRKPNSKMLDMPVAPPRPSICRYSAVRSPPFQKLFSKLSASSVAFDSNERLRKMMAQDISEAIASNPMTTCTTGLALITSLTMESSFSIGNLRVRSDEIGQGSRAERAGVDAHHAHFTIGHHGTVARDHLLEADRGAAFWHGHAAHGEIVIEPRGFTVVHVRLGHREH